MFASAIEILRATLNKYFETASSDRQLILGENVDVGSHISGLSLFLKDTTPRNASIVNLPNVWLEPLGRTSFSLYQTTRLHNAIH